MPNLYQLKISLVEPNYPIRQLHRVLEVKGNANFYELHQAIFDAFDREDDEHLWKFCISRTKCDSLGKLWDCSETIELPADPLWDDKELRAEDAIIHEPDMTLDELNLKEKDYLYYWFDFGDDWVHRILIEKINKCDDNTPIVQLIKKVGESPKQYGDESIWGANGVEFMNQLPMEFLTGELSYDEMDKAIDQIAVALVIQQIKERQQQGKPMQWNEFGLPEFRQMLMESGRFMPYQALDENIKLNHLEQ